MSTYNDRRLSAIPYWLAMLSVVGGCIILLQTYVDLLPLPLSHNARESMAFLGRIIVALGTLLYLWPILVRRFTYRPAGSDPKKVRDHYLCDTGPYRIVRHPAYAAIVIMVVGVEIIASSWLLFVIPCICAALLAKVAKIEERDLSRMYRHQHETYRKRVPWLLMPYIY